MAARSITLHLENEAATKRLGEDLALAINAGELVCLSGDLGIGKSTLARAMIQTACDDADLEVPSPTFTLVQTYSGNCATGSIAHYDLYRLEEAEEAAELGIDEAIDTGIALIEWPGNGAGYLPETSLQIEFRDNGPSARIVTLSGRNQTIERIERSLAIRKFLDENWHQNVDRRYMLGDASTRAYEAAEYNGEKRILMNSPPMADGPVIANGKPYSQIAHLAENVRPFLAIADVLREHGFEAPEIFAHDLDEGFLLIGHLGDEGVLNDRGEPDPEKYLASVEILAEIHNQSWPEAIPLADGSKHIIPHYDHDAMMIEVDLLAKWYVPRMSGQLPDENALQEFEAIWEELIAKLRNSEKTLVLRDYHSPNLLWLNDGKSSAKIGLIDFQDAMIGPSAYDLASLAQDARVTVSAELEQTLIAEYLKTRTSSQPTFDRDNFLEAYAIMAAQRVTKVLGIFIRLDERDGKPAYLAHLPRLQTYLKRSLEHPVLEKFKHWLTENAGF